MRRAKSAANMKFNQAQKHAVPRTRAASRRHTARGSRARAGGLIMLVCKPLFIELFSIHQPPNVANIAQHERH